MDTDKIIQEIIDLDEKMDKLPHLSVKEAEVFDAENMISSVFYSNLLEGNNLSREEATKAMRTENNNELDK